MAKQIVLVEDELTIAQNYMEALRRQGYHVNHFTKRHEAEQHCAVKLPDLAIIDVGLQDEPEGGFDLCRSLRALSNELPIIFLSARGDDFDVISGLRLGADDYLTKDISLVHLTARINALFRRMEALSKPVEQAELITRGDLTIDLQRMVLTWQGKPVDLTVTEFWIVHSLAGHPGHVKNRQQLMDAANVVLDDNTITSHIKRIRKKFKEHDNQFDFIQTAYGLGYRWLAERKRG